MLRKSLVALAIIVLMAGLAWASQLVPYNPPVGVGLLVFNDGDPAPTEIDVKEGATPGTKRFKSPASGHHVYFAEDPQTGDPLFFTYWTEGEHQPVRFMETYVFAKVVPPPIPLLEKIVFERLLQASTDGGVTWQVVQQEQGIYYRPGTF